MSTAAVALAAMLLTTEPAFAREGGPNVVGKPSVEQEPWPSALPPFRWWEYVGTAALLGGSLALRYGVDVSGEPVWRGGILLDEPVYDALLITSPRLFRDWRSAGDVGYIGSFAWSALDPLLAGLTYDWYTALQMTMMNLEAFGVYSTVLSISQLIVRRERPATRECRDPERASELGISCGGANPNVNRSFIGGHTGTVATAAALTCMHHAYLPLWGSPAADALPCVTWTAMTALVFTSRTLTGQHYLSDNLFGLMVGVTSALVPWSLHYAAGELGSPSPGGAETPAWTLTGASLSADPEGATLRVHGLIH